MKATFDSAQIAKDFESQAQLTSDKRQEILAKAQAIDVNDAFTSTGFGTKEQRDLGDLSDLLLKRASGNALEDALDTIYALQKEITSLDVASLYTPKGCLVKLFAPGKRQYASLRKNYTEMSYLVDRLANQIDLAGLALQKEMSLLDSLYESNLTCYRALESRILAGEQALAIEEENTTSTNNNSSSFVSLFQDRLFQLKQSKTVSMQLALQIRLTQYNQQVVTACRQSPMLMSWDFVYLRNKLHN